MPSKAVVVHSDPEIMGGIPVFVGTRVPVKTLYDYLAAGDPLDDFLNDFPSVTREQAIAALELAREMTEAHATTARWMCPSAAQAARARYGRVAPIAVVSASDRPIRPWRASRHDRAEGSALQNQIQSDNLVR